MKLASLGTGTFHILTNTVTDGDRGYRADTACGIKDAAWDQTFVDQMPSGGVGGACEKCQVAAGYREAPTTKKTKKSK